MTDPVTTHPHGLTPGWSDEEIAADLVTLRRVLAHYEALGWADCASHPTRLRQQLVGMARYAFCALEVLASQKVTSP